MMRYLLDSHVFLWYDESHARLSAAHRELLDDSANELYLSVASIWELTIKRSLGRLAASARFRDSAKRLDIEIMAITVDHAEQIEGLPRHHSDPFDHMLIAQAKVEGLVLVTHDRILAEYDVAVLRV